MTFKDDFEKKLFDLVYTKILSNKKYRSFPKKFLLKVFFEVIQENRDLVKSLIKVKNFKRSKLFRKFFSIIKSKLYKISIMYFVGDSFISSIERKEYPYCILKFIHEKNIKSILDLGCGFHPLEFPFPNTNINFYFACDINEEIISRISKSFINSRTKNITIEVKVLDFVENLDRLPLADVAFLFKVLDLIDKRGHKNAEKVLTNLNVKYIIVSFPLVTLSGKAMRFYRRTWLEHMLNRLNYSFFFEIYNNEIFYFIEKRK